MVCSGLWNACSCMEPTLGTMLAGPYQLPILQTSRYECDSQQQRKLLWQKEMKLISSSLSRSVVLAENPTPKVTGIVRKRPGSPCPSFVPPKPVLGAKK